MNIAHYPETIGVILAGGQSRRMGGQDKARLILDGLPLAAHVAKRLAPQCTRVILNTNSNAADFGAFGVPVIADSFQDYRGPLAGILAALDWMAQHAPSTEWLASIAVDTPFFPEDFVARLHAARLESSAHLVMAHSGARRHPVNALWSVTLREPLRATLLADESRKVGMWMQTQGAAVASWNATPFDPFLNINTPEEFAAVRNLRP